tara:strand:- start:1243 stop:1482 length:240 start_codon:yes stop_codon:yes gene_type:complete
MFSLNEKKEIDLSKNSSEELSIDKLTLWLIRLACIFIIIFFSGIILGLPILISLAKSQYTSFSIGIRELLKSTLEIYLS